MRSRFWLLLASGLGLARLCEAALVDVPGTQPLTETGDLSGKMVAGISAHLVRLTAEAFKARARTWQRDFSSPEAYANSVAGKRTRLRHIIGAVDAPVPATHLEYLSDVSSPALVAETDAFTVYAVRWAVFDGVFGEGLWLRPKGAVVARMIVIPDADQTPEMLVGLSSSPLPAERQFARRLAENGCEVLIPVLIDRRDTWSGNPAINRLTNQPHREWIYRQAYELGRHIIGYEVQKISAAVDWFSTQPAGNSDSNRLAVAGYGEGGLIALYAAALDLRLKAALVSGYFNSRQDLWQEPIYRNVFGFLSEFGDAELATLVAPRGLVIEHSVNPKVDGPPSPRPGRSGAAPGRLATPNYQEVENEYEHARTLLTPGGKAFDTMELISGTEGMATGPGSDRALLALLRRLGLQLETLKPSGKVPTELRAAFDPDIRQRRQVAELVDFTQKIFRQSEQVRLDGFWSKLKMTSAQDWAKFAQPWRQTLWDEVMGRLLSSEIALNPRARRLDQPQSAAWTAYEVVLDVCPDVFAWGYLLLPNDLKPSEKRPVVVCQHGLEGLPADVINEDRGSRAFGYYKAFGARLAERGFIVFVPHNPYRGEAAFRKLQRQANPLGLSLFSFIIAQHNRILDWLSSLPFIDPQRIAFYGLSYGGKTAMRVPAVLDRYCLSICSGDFNEWVRKNTSIDYPASYMFLGEHEMPEFDLGSTFNYAEMAALIAPRPFMVERGHDDGVGKDEWVAYEYAKVRRLYDSLGIGQLTEIEFFNGPHTINAKGTFDFLHKHLAWPERGQPAR